MKESARDRKIRKLDQAYYAAREALMRPSKKEQRAAVDKFWCKVELLVDGFKSLAVEAAHAGISVQDFAAQMLPRLQSLI